MSFLIIGWFIDLAICFELLIIHVSLHPSIALPVPLQVDTIVPIDTTARMSPPPMTLGPRERGLFNFPSD